MNNYRASRHAEPAPTPPEPQPSPAEAPREEISRWSLVFETGHHWFSFDLPELPCDPAIDPRGWDATEGPFVDAIREAWARLGVAFLAGWKPQQPGDRVWALKAFGDPSGPLRKPRKRTDD